MATIFGLDISTSITGIAILKGETIIAIDHIDFKKCNNIWEKTDVVKNKIDNLSKQFNLFPGEVTIAVEQPLMGFQAGMSSAQTITTLSQFNGIVSYIARDKFKINPEFVSAAHARKVCGMKMQKTKVAGMSHKEQVFKYMSENDLKHIVWPTKKKSDKLVEWSRDCTDAYVIARAFYLMNK